MEIKRFSRKWLGIDCNGQLKHVALICSRLPQNILYLRSMWVLQIIYETITNVISCHFLSNCPLSDRNKSFVIVKRMQPSYGTNGICIKDCLLLNDQFWPKNEQHQIISSYPTICWCQIRWLHRYFWYFVTADDNYSLLTWQQPSYILPAS